MSQKPPTMIGFLWMCCSLALLAPTHVLPPDTVRVETGMLVGSRSNDGTVRIFKGVPYAAPPVGGLRWRPPHPPSAWSGARRAVHFGATCMQVHPPEGSFYHEEFFLEPQPISEDCLYINIWSPVGVDDAPVMMWIHGGGFTQGAGSMPSFDGAALARDGVVVVTINYRLGVFGLLAHPDLTAETEHESSGNYGLLDQIAALRWIQQNIEAFGGDPARVTIFGQSSGAGNVNTLMASPLADELFHRAILQSGSTYGFGRKQTLEEAERDGVRFARSTGTVDLADLRAIPSDSLLQWSSRTSFMPNVDGWLLPEPVDVAFAHGRQHDVPIMAGSTSDEGNTLFGPGLTSERYRELVRSSFGDDSDAFLELYPAATDDDAKRSFNRSFSDELAWGAHELAVVHARTSTSPAYLYYFTRVPPGRNAARYGAFHSSDLVYVFGTLESVQRPWTQVDRSLSKTIRAYWVNFATSGNPNGDHLPDWPKYDRAGSGLMELGDDVKPRGVLDAGKRAFFEMRWKHKYPD